MFNEGVATKCEIEDKFTARITMKFQSNLMIHGKISNFKNPYSAKPVRDIIIELYDKDLVAWGMPSVAAKNAAKKPKLVAAVNLLNFKPASVEVQLTSTSGVVGAQGQNLTIHVNPHTVLTAQGYIVLHIPEYYKDAGKDYMVTNKVPEPCSCSAGKVTSCEFDTMNAQVQIRYEFSSGFAIKDKVDFTISFFNNPVVEDQGGFSLEVMDGEFDGDGPNLISTSKGIALSGID